MNLLKPHQRALLDRFWNPPCGCSRGYHREDCPHRRPRYDLRAVARMFGRSRV